MPRDGSGNYTLPVGNPVITGTTIESTWANTTMPDVGQELTNSLDRNGRGGMLTALRGVDGTPTAPAYSFNTEVGTGWYREGAEDIRFALATTPQMRLATLAFNILPSLRVGGAIDDAAQAIFETITDSVIGGILTSTAAASTASGPRLRLARAGGASSPGDGGGQLSFFGPDDADAQVEYAQVEMEMSAVGAGVETGEVKIRTRVLGTISDCMLFSAGAWMPGATGGDQGAGTINAAGLFVDGEEVLPQAAIPVPNVQVYTANNGTWTKPAGLKYVIAEVVGGGGGGGGSGNTASGEQSNGGGGAGGGYARLLIAEGDLGPTESWTRGAGGSGVSSAAGANGNTSSFGTHITGTGGNGGAFRDVNTSNNSGAGGSGGNGTGGDINAGGDSGGTGSGGIGGSNARAAGGVGGGSIYGGGGRGAGDGGGGAGGSAGLVYGGGGGGSCSSGSGGTNRSGGGGANGIIIVTEYF